MKRHPPSSEFRLWSPPAPPLNRRLPGSCSAAHTRKRTGEGRRGANQEHQVAMLQRQNGGLRPTSRSSASTGTSVPAVLKRIRNISLPRRARQVGLIALAVILPSSLDPSPSHLAIQQRLAPQSSNVRINVKPDAAGCRYGGDERLRHEHQPQDIPNLLQEPVKLRLQRLHQQRA